MASIKFSLCFRLHLVFISIIRIHMTYIRIYSTVVALAKWDCPMPSCSGNYFISCSECSWALASFALEVQTFLQLLGYVPELNGGLLKGAEKGRLS